MDDQLIQYLKDQRLEWLGFLNTKYKTDLGEPITDYAKGRLTAYIEIINWIENKDKENGRSD